MADELITNDDLVLRKVLALKVEAERERDQFVQEWDLIEDQAAQKGPSSWHSKEAWQSKIFIPLQSKALETFDAVMFDIQRGNGDWFDFEGMDTDDKDRIDGLKRFIQLVLRMGKFEINNGFCYTQAGKIGSSYMKKIVDSSGKFPIINFTYRSARNVLTDPKAVVDFTKSRYYMETHSVDLFDILASDIYSDKKKDHLLMMLQGSTGSELGKDIVQIPFGNNKTDYRISSEYLEVKMIEFWGKLPITVTEGKGDSKVTRQKVEERIVTVINDRLILRNDKNDLGFIPVSRNRIKRREGHGGGKGILTDGIGIQDLANSLVNLSFDSAKIDLPMLKHETGALANPDDMEIKPLGSIETKPGKFGLVEIVRTNTSNISSMVQNVALLDQFHQEATGVLRQASGGDSQFQGDETLGQTKIKLQAAQTRLLKIARDNAEDYLIPLLRNVWKLITHPQFINGFQKLADRSIGFRDGLGTEGDLQSKKVILRDPESGEEQEKERESMVDLKRLGKLDLDFAPLGVTSFSKKQEDISKLESFAKLILPDEGLRQEIHPDILMRKLATLSEIPDMEDIFKTDEEKQEEQEQQQAQVEQLMQQAQAGDPNAQGIEQQLQASIGG